MKTQFMLKLWKLISVSNGNGMLFLVVFMFSVLVMLVCYFFLVFGLFLCYQFQCQGLFDIDTFCFGLNALDSFACFVSMCCICMFWSICLFWFQCFGQFWFEWLLYAWPILYRHFAWNLHVLLLFKCFWIDLRVLV